MGDPASGATPRGPFNFAPYPVSLTRVVLPHAIGVPEPESVSAAAATLAVLVLRRVRSF